MTPREEKPTPLSAKVSQQLSRMPVANTTPEVRLRSALHSLGLRFRLGSKLPGRPDIVFTRSQIAVFVDGCFWHSCPEHGATPKNNRDWWVAKLERNVERDAEKDDALRALGWTVVHVWEHEEPLEVAERIRQLVQARLQLP